MPHVRAKNKRVVTLPAPFEQDVTRHSSVNVDTSHPLIAALIASGDIEVLDSAPAGFTGESPRGVALHTVASAPPSSLGQDGDYAINPGTSELYGPKAAGAWPSSVSLKGDPGAPTSELDYKDLAANYATTGAGAGTETDVTGLSLTFVMPNRPVLLRFFAPSWQQSVVAKSTTIRFRKVSGATAANAIADGADLFTASAFAQVAAMPLPLSFDARLDPAIWTPGNQFVIKAMANVNTAGGVATLVNNATSKTFLRAL